MESLSSGFYCKYMRGWYGAGPACVCWGGKLLLLSSFFFFFLISSSPLLLFWAVCSSFRDGCHLQRRCKDFGFFGGDLALQLLLHDLVPGEPGLQRVGDRTADPVEQPAQRR